MGAECFIAETAVVIGEVEMGDQCSVWYNAVLRGDVHYIRMGHKVNVQDGVMIHGTYMKAATEIGNNVSIHGSVALTDTETNDYCIRDGIVVLRKGAYIPNGTRIGLVNHHSHIG